MPDHTSLRWFARQKRFDGGWTPILSDSDPRQAFAVKAKQGKVADVCRVPPAALTLTLGQVNQVAPGGIFFSEIWRRDFMALNPDLGEPDDATRARARSAAEVVGI